MKISTVAFVVALAGVTSVASGRRLGETGHYLAERKKKAMMTKKMNRGADEKHLEMSKKRGENVRDERHLSTAAIIQASCSVPDRSWLGDGECDGGVYNVEECGWDGGDCIIDELPDCHVDDPSMIGDGTCDGAEYNIYACDWDGSDCIHNDYPDCHVSDPTYLADDHCDGGEYATEACGWDAGDCDSDPDGTCDVSMQSWLSDGRCDLLLEEHNTLQCDWDGGDCIVPEYPDCHVQVPDFLGDGECDGGAYSTPECGFDLGDCPAYQSGRNDDTGGGENAGVPMQRLLYLNDFEDPNRRVFSSCGGGADIRDDAINILFSKSGFKFHQQETVEVVHLDGLQRNLDHSEGDPIFENPQGVGGNFAIGMFSDQEEDKLSLTLDTHDFSFLNIGMSLAAANLPGCGGPFTYENRLYKPKVHVSVLDSPELEGDFNGWGEPPLDEGDLEGSEGSGSDLADLPFKLDWGYDMIGLDVSSSSDGYVTIVFDLESVPYAIFDDLIIVGSSTKWPCNEDEPYVEDPECDCSKVSCAVGKKCDPYSCLCFDEDLLAPCVAVIDEDDDFNCNNWNGNTPCTQEDLWDLFRQEYRYRPFCLLIPADEANDPLSLPDNFLNDGNKVIKYGIDRNGAIEDWASYCELDGYTSNNVQFIGLFVDNSGSMYRSTVQNSIDQLYDDCGDQGMELKEVYNADENWILPFLTSLKPEEQ